MSDTPNFRALCAELAKLLQNCPVTADTDWIAERMTLLYSARAALATPPPAPPTDEELQALWHELFSHDDTVSSGDVEVIARAVLERWGHG